MRAHRVASLALLSLLAVACDPASAPVAPSLSTTGGSADSEYVCCGLGVTRIVLSRQQVTLAPADTAAVRADLKAFNGWTLDAREAGRLVVWTSSDSTVATVVATGRNTARVRGVAGGTATVTAYVQGKTAALAVTVSGAPATTTPTAPAAPVVKTITITPGATTLAAGQTVQFAAAAKDSAGTAIAGVPVTWKSTDTTIVRVSATGAATGVAPGAVTLSATAGGVTAGVSVGVQHPTTTEPAPSPTAPAPTPGVRVGFYVAPTGSAAGNGSITSPWDLTTALNHPGAVSPGDTIWLRGGTYRGSFTSRLSGTAAAPIVVRQLPGERATVDGNLVILGRGTTYWGFEVMNSNTSRPAVIGVNVKGPNTKFVNMVVHDHGDNGFGFWSEAPDSEIYGSIIYNNGRQGSTRGMAHGIYAQNGTGTKRIVDNVVFNQFAYGIHVYGSDAVSLRNFHIEGNASFFNGLSASGGGAPDILVGGGSSAANITVRENHTYRTDQGTTAVFGYNWGPTNADLTLANNTLVGNTNIITWNDITATGNTFTGAQTVVMLRMPDGVPTTRYNWRSNKYFPSIGQWSPFNLFRNGGSAGYDLAGWQAATGLDAGSTLTRGTPTGTQVHVRPNQYEAGRANVIVYNWARVGSVSVNPSSFMWPGTRYEVRSVHDFYGAPVASGTYSGGSITIPIRAEQPKTPIGGSVTAPSTGTEFNAYVIVRVEG